MRKNIINFVFFYLGIIIIYILKNNLLYFYIIFYLIYIVFKKSTPYYIIGFLLYGFLFNYHLILKIVIFFNIHILFIQMIKKHIKSNIFIFWLSSVIYFISTNKVEKLIFNYNDINYLLVFSLNLFIINYIFRKIVATDEVFR